MSPMVRLILVKENTKKKRTMSSFFLQGRALGPPQISSSYNFENENGERIPS
jgi:hypothetical protein